jgi:DNA-binding PadR family transcriptional regulator
MFGPWSARRGRFGGAFSPFGAFGEAWEEAWQNWMRSGPWGGGQGRRVDRGDMKYLILTVLKDGPKHGYEIMREIEQRAHGIYTPSPGTIYPTLQLLEDMGYVRSQEVEQRRVYELTEAGRTYLSEHQEAANEAWRQFEEPPWRKVFPGFGNEEQRQLRNELFDLARTLFTGGRIFRADPATLAKVREIIRNARQQIDAALTTYV